MGYAAEVEQEARAAFAHGESFGSISRRLGCARAPVTKVPMGCPLTRNELALVQEFADGRSYSQIADARDRDPSSVRSMAQRVCRKLGVRDRTQSVIVAAKAGWVETAYELAVDDEAAMQRRLYAVIAELAEAVRAQRLEPLSDLQRSYLARFEEYLYSTPGERDNVRQRMSHALTPMLAEAGVDPNAITVRRGLDRALERIMTADG
jgi:DNA-binding CsgD family transcriptional regulator